MRFIFFGFFLTLKGRIAFGVLRDFLLDRFDEVSFDCSIRCSDVYLLFIYEIIHSEGGFFDQSEGGFADEDTTTLSVAFHFIRDDYIWTVDIVSDDPCADDATDNRTLNAKRTGSIG